MDITDSANETRSAKMLCDLDVLGKAVENWMKPLYLFIYYKDFRLPAAVQPLEHSNYVELMHKKWINYMKKNDDEFFFNGRPYLSIQDAMQPRD